MKKNIIRNIFFSVLIVFPILNFATEKTIDLPDPSLKSGKSFKQILDERRTKRVYSEKELDKVLLSQLLWAAQGITDDKNNFRAAPSAGALYPLEIYMIIQNKGIEGLRNGLYQYIPGKHQIKLLKTGNLNGSLAKVGYSQDFFAQSPLCFIITAVPQRTTQKYGERGYRYIHIEVGHVGQNIQLQGTALGLAVGIAGAFRDNKLSELLNLDEGEIPLYLMPVGYPKK